MTDYKLRAECQADISELINTFIGEVTEVKIHRFKDIPDVEAEITLNTDKSIKEIKTDIDHYIIDSHIMAETIQPTLSYTGERKKDF